MRIEDAIQQKQFANAFQKAQVNIVFTAAWLNQRHAQIMKPFGISIQQFNILRILKGMKGEPATVKILTEKMIDKMSNASRLVEKLKQKGLVERSECPHDRRRVDIFITEEGLTLVDEASAVLEAANIEQMSDFSEAEAEELSRLLDKLREKE